MTAANPSIIHVSPRGLQRLEERLEAQRSAHAALCKEREVAHELSGDGWHDNPHFNYLQQMEANSTWKIREFEQLIGSARVFQVEEGARPIHKVVLGSVVHYFLTDLKSGEEEAHRVELVGHEESDPAQGKVAYNAPIGRALLGLEEGDGGELRLPRGAFYLEVTELFPSRAAAGLDEGEALNMGCA